MKFLAIAKSASQRLSGLVSGSLDLSRLEEWAVKRISLCLCVSVVLPFSGCAFGRLKPGLTKAGAAVAVAAPSAAEARRTALLDSLELFLAPGTADSARMVATLGDRAAEFTGRMKWKAGKGVVDVSFAKVLAVLDRDGLLRPRGFPSREPRVLLLVSEPQSALGVGAAADALRRGLYARGMTAIDGRDRLESFKARLQEPAALAAGAARVGADWMIVAAASASAELDPASSAWRGRATLIANQYEVKSATPVAQSEFEASALDVSSMAARGKALEAVGEEAASKVAATVARSLGGRSQGVVFVAGGPNVARLKSLLAALRAVDGVAGAYLGVWRGEEESVIVRVFLTGLKVDDLAARLLRLNSSLTLLSVEPDAGRLAVELGGQ
jgi:hypothetical protein